MQNLPAHILAFIAGLDLDALTDMAVDLLDGDATEDEVVEAISTVVDAITPFDTAIPKPIGPLVETVADHVVPFIVRNIVQRVATPEARQYWANARATVAPVVKARRAKPARDLGGNATFDVTVAPGVFQARRVIRRVADNATATVHQAKIARLGVADAFREELDASRVLGIEEKVIPVQRN